MPLKSLVREFKEIKGGIGSISRRNFEVRISNHIRARSQSLAVEDGQNGLDHSEQSCWADLPPELLRDVLERVESSESTWPARRHVVACASVCRTWREIVKELVNNPEESTKLTFPTSLKQPGPRDPTVQCFIKRDRATSIYYLYLGLTPTLSVENGKFLLAARKVRRATSTDYILSLSADDLYRGSNTYIGKLRSNFLGTKFIIHDSHPMHSSSMVSTSHGGRGIGSSNASFRVPGNNFNVACISYELNVLGTRGPRRMQCTLYSIPATAMEAGENAQTEVPSAVVGDSFSSISFSKPLGPFPVLHTTELESLTKADSKIRPLILKNKAPRWHEQLQCWCLNFRGRVTVASVKNFQLVAAVEPGQSMGQSDHDNKVLLQFGKIEKDIFTMDYRYPLSAFQAFAICLSSFDTKLACE